MASGGGEWCLIESDPGVFTELIRGFGTYWDYSWPCSNSLVIRIISFSIGNRVEIILLSFDFDLPAGKKLSPWWYKITLQPVFDIWDVSQPNRHYQSLWTWWWLTRSQWDGIAFIARFCSLSELLYFFFAFNVFRCQIKHVSLFLMQPFTCKRNQGIEREALSPGFLISQHSNSIYLY